MAIVAYIFIFITTAVLLSMLYHALGIDFELVIDEVAKYILGLLIVLFLTYILGIAFGLPSFEIKVIF